MHWGGGRTGDAIYEMTKLHNYLAGIFIDVSKFGKWSTTNSRSAAFLHLTNENFKFQIIIRKV